MSTRTMSIHDAAATFLAARRIAVTGVSRDPKGANAANAVYRRLRERGYEVVAVNPAADEVEGDACYHRLADIPGGVDAVVIASPPATAEAIVDECAALGVHQVWMHRSVGGGSVCAEATVRGRARGMTVIDGGCPLMFAPTSDPAHRVMRAVFTLVGHVPRRVPVPAEAVT